MGGLGSRRKGSSQPNYGVQATASSVRSYVAPASAYSSQMFVCEIENDWPSLAVSVSSKGNDMALERIKLGGCPKKSQCISR
jgi:hypothetical protein